MKLSTLRYFKTAAETQNITKAAFAANASPSAISKGIRSLEQELDCELFEHNGNNITLNSNGLILLEASNKILEYIYAAQEELYGRNMDGKSVISLLAPMDFIYLPQIMAGFQHEHPQTSIRLLQLPSYINSTQNNYADVTLYSSFYPKNEEQDRMFCQDDYYLAISVDHPLAQSPHVTISQVASLSLIYFSHELRIRPRIDTFCHMHGLPPCQFAGVNQTRTINELIANGSHASLVPRYSNRFIHNPRIMMLPITDASSCHYLNVKWKPYAYYNQNIRLFTDYLLNFAKQHL